MKAIIFDLQGTLVENGVFPSPIKQVKYVLGVRDTFHDYVPVFESIFMTRKFASLADAFKEVATGFDVQIDDLMIERLVGIWNKNKLLSKLYLDTIDVLKDLKKDYKLILIANIDCFSRDVIEKFHLEEYFDKIFFSYETGILKNDERFYVNILEQTGLDHKEVIAVGDSVESDMKSALNAGIKCVLIDRNNRMDFDTKISRLADLRESIEKLQ